jgi:Tfp pilus assembly protein PilO
MGLSGVTIVLLWSMLLYGPARNKTDRLRTEREQIQIQLDDYRSTVAKIPEFLARRDSLRLSREAMESSLYAKADILSLLDRIGQEARGHGLMITETTPSVAELLTMIEYHDTPNEPDFLTIHFYLKGSYPGFGKFVGALEDAPYFRGITSCYITRPYKRNAETTYLVGVKALLGTVRTES